MLRVPQRLQLADGLDLLCVPSRTEVYLRITVTVEIPLALTVAQDTLESQVALLETFPHATILTWHLHALCVLVQQPGVVPVVMEVRMGNPNNLAARHAAIVPSKIFRILKRHLAIECQIHISTTNRRAIR